MGKRYKRKELEVQAEQYKLNCGMEDGFEAWKDVVVNGWVNSKDIIKITKADGNIVVPYIESRRGRYFIKENDYIITEGDGEKHVCGVDKFNKRFVEIEE